MKKNYIAPNSKVVKLRIMSNMMQSASVAGTSGLGRTLNTGGTTTSADSRRNNDWGWDDDDEY
jgi:hypothetical protein